MIYNFLALRCKSLSCCKDNLTKTVEKGHTVLKKNQLRQLLALLLPALHVSLQHLLRCRESGKSCSTFDIPTFRDHSGQLEVSPMGSSRSLVQIRWKRLGSNQV